MLKIPSFQHLIWHTKESMQQNKYLKYFQAINEALVFSMRRDKKMICYGLGVTDPKKYFQQRLI